jgi:fermentation-respiration switch protein FrsA (DUF1100 family)
MASTGSSRRTVVMTVLVVLGAVLAIGAGMWAAQRRLIYFPDRRTPVFDLGGAGWEEVAFTTSDGLTLHGWYTAPPPGAAVVIVFSGNAGNRGDRAPLGMSLAAEGLGVLLTDYRGYGGNPGDPTESGLHADAAAAASFIHSRAPEHDLVYFGESLGSAVAIGLAVEHPPAALVLRSPFTSMVDVGRRHYPWFPVGSLLKDRYPSLERLGAVPAPVLVIAGDADSIVPVDQSRAIYDAAGDSKELLVIRGADHNDPELVHGPEVVSVTARFIEEYSRSSP